MQKNRLFRIGFILALVLFVGAGLSRINFNIEILKLLPTHLGQVEGLSLFLKHFSLPNELIITVNADNPELAEEGATKVAAVLRARTDLVKRALSEPPWEKKPEQLAELVAFLVMNQSPENVTGLIERLSAAKAPATVQKTLQRLNDSFSPQEVALLSYDPYGLASGAMDLGGLSGAEKSEFSSADGMFRVVYVETTVPFANYKKTIAWMREIRSLARGAAPPGVTLGFTGEPAFVADISSTTEWDMASSGFITLLIIAAIFWGFHRRARPLFDLQLMLLLIFTISLAAAGLFLNELTVIGVGFASIMIGLSVDYGFLIHQRSLTHTGTLRELQWHCLRDIRWTSGTTAAAFFSLNFSSLPGLSQLGNLVGIGVLVGGAVMLLVFAPMALRWKKHTAEATPAERWLASESVRRRGAWATSALVLFLGGTLLVKGLPGVDGSARSLRPRESEAYAALDQMLKHLADDSQLLSLVISGKNEEEVAQRLQVADEKLRVEQKKGHLLTLQTPVALWPQEQNQTLNLARLASLAGESERLKKTVLDAGFTAESYLLTQAVFHQLQIWSLMKTPIWPGNEASRWIYRRVSAKSDAGWVAMGMVTPVAGEETALGKAVQSEGVWLVSWNQLGAELKRVIPGEFGRLIVSLLVVVLLLLGIAFGGVRDLLVLVFTHAVVFVSWLGAMSLLGLQWNFFNLAAILLLLGTGIDYAILLLLALKRNGGDVQKAHQSLAAVIFLCAGSAAAGFGTIGWANNQGLASLGITCALGLILDALITLFLLPHFWRWSRGRW